MTSQVPKLAKVTRFHIIHRLTLYLQHIMVLEWTEQWRKANLLKKKGGKLFYLFFFETCDVFFEIWWLYSKSYNQPRTTTKVGQKRFFPFEKNLIDKIIIYFLKAPFFLENSTKCSIPAIQTHVFRSNPSYCLKTPPYRTTTSNWQWHLGKNSRSFWIWPSWMRGHFLFRWCLLNLMWVVKCRGIDMVLDGTREAWPGFPLCPCCLSHQEEEGKEQPWKRGEGNQRDRGLSGGQGRCKEKAAAETFQYRMIWFDL